MFTQAHRFIALSTPLGADALGLVRFSLYEKLGEPYRIEFEAVVQDEDINPTDAVGHQAVMRVVTPVGASPVRYFHGILASLTLCPDASRHVRVRGVIVPELQILASNRACRIFQDRTVPDIVKSVLAERGYVAIDSRISLPHRTWDYCVQYRESDLAFINRLLEQEGITYFFEHSKSEHKLVLVDSPGAHCPGPGYEHLTFRSPSAEKTEWEFATSWEVNQQVVPSVYTTYDFNPEKPSVRLRASADAPLATGGAGLEIFDYPGEYKTPAEGEHTARVRLESGLLRAYTATGSARSVGMQAGCTVTLRGHPRAELNRKYLLVSTILVCDAGEFDSSESVSEASVQLEAIPAEVPYRTPQVTPKPTIPGPQTGIVAGPSGEEIHVDKLGRIMVQFHWDREGKGDQKSSCWIRVAQTWAGRGWGALVVPRIGMEVVVQFLEGDPDRPLVTGCVYNEQNPAPYGLPGEKTQTGIRTNTHKGTGYNELRFDDKTGDEQIFIHAQKDMDLRVRNDVRETIQGDVDTRIGGSKGQGNLNSWVAKDQNEKIDGSRYGKIGKDEHLQVGGDAALAVKKSRSVVVEKTDSTNAEVIQKEASRAIHLKSAAVHVQGTDAIHLKAGMVCIEADSMLSLKVGGNFVSITAAGVAVNGSMILLNSGGSAQPAKPAKSTAPVTMKDPVEAVEAKQSSGGRPPATPEARSNQARPLAYKPAPPPPATTPPVASPTAFQPPPATQAPFALAGCVMPAWKLSCKHGGRRPGADNGCDVEYLEVVGDRTKRSSFSFPAGESPLFKLECEEGGSDVINVECRGFTLCAKCGRKPLVRVSGDVALLVEASRSVEVFNSQVQESPFANGSSYSVYRFMTDGVGCAPRTVEVRVYPSPRYKLTGALSEGLTKRFSGLFDGLLGKLLRFADIDLPKVKFSGLQASGEWGFEEVKSSHRVFRKVAISLEASVKLWELGKEGGPPPLEAGTALPQGGLRLSLGLLQFFGPGASIVRFAADLCLVLTLQVDISIRLKGERTGLDSKSRSMSGGVEGSVPVSVALEVAPAVRSRVLGYRASGGLSTTLKAGGEAAYDGERGFGIKALKFGWESGYLGLKFEVKGAGWFSWGSANYARETKVWGDGMFPSEDGYEWFPFSEADHPVCRED